MEILVKNWVRSTGCPKKLYLILKFNFGAENIYALKMFIFLYSKNLYNLR